jgi:hypothetical protein
VLMEPGGNDLPQRPGHGEEGRAHPRVDRRRPGGPRTWFGRLARGALWRRTDRLAAWTELAEQADHQHSGHDHADGPAASLPSIRSRSACWECTAPTPPINPSATAIF